MKATASMLLSSPNHTSIEFYVYRIDSLYIYERYSFLLCTIPAQRRASRSTRGRKEVDSSRGAAWIEGCSGCRAGWEKTAKHAAPEEFNA